LADKKKPGLLENTGKRVAAQADALKAGAAAALREKAAGIREAIGPDKLEPVKQPERPFGRDEGGEDVKRVVWTGHTIQTREGQAYFGAVGLTEGGYYRAAEVQLYGSEEVWRWQGELHTVKDDAQKSAENMSANLLNPESTPAKTNQKEAWKTGPESEKLEANNMALPEHVKAEADAAIAKTGMEKAAYKDMNTAQAVDNYPDAGASLDTMREQKRKDAIQDKTPEPDKDPDKA
jgi:hypothetical protein